MSIPLTGYGGQTTEINPTNPLLAFTGMSYNTDDILVDLPGQLLLLLRLGGSDGRVEHREPHRREHHLRGSLPRSIGERRRRRDRRFGPFGERRRRQRDLRRDEANRHGSRVHVQRRVGHSHQPVEQHWDRVLDHHRHESTAATATPRTSTSRFSSSGTTRSSTRPALESASRSTIRSSRSSSSGRGSGSPDERARASADSRRVTATGTEPVNEGHSSFSAKQARTSGISLAPCREVNAASASASRGHSLSSAAEPAPLPAGRRRLPRPCVAWPGCSRRACSFTTKSGGGAAGAGAR